MRIIALGIRGFPDVQGGVETHAQQLYVRLAKLGCDVQVLARSMFVPKDRKYFDGVRLTRIWAPGNAGMEALVHSFLAVLYAAIVRPDILHIHAVGPALVTPLARLFGLKVVVTHHGPDYDRDKWGRFARWVLRSGESAGMRYSNARVAISRVIVELIRSKYHRTSDLIPNGVCITKPAVDSTHVRHLGLEPGRYFLQVSRIVPEKRQLDLIDAYAIAAPLPWKLALVGDIGTDRYSSSVILAARNSGVVLAGFQTGEPLKQLYTHAGAFVLPSTHEGLPIAMLEAMSYGVPIIASDIPANLEVGLGADCYFKAGDVQSLATLLNRQVHQPATNEIRTTLRQQVMERYNWDRIAEQTLQVFRRVEAG